MAIYRNIYGYVHIEGLVYVYGHATLNKPNSV